MRTVLLALTAASLLRRLRLHQNHTGQFETLEECEKAYDALLEKSQVTTDPEYADDGKPPATEDEGSVDKKDATPTTTTTTTTTTARPIRKDEEGHPDHKDAAPAYHPPTPTTGDPSENSGYDYGEHGADWTSLPDGAQCGSSGQSPIDIVKYVDIKGQTKSVLWFDYYADPTLDASRTGTLHNDGHAPYFHDESIKLGSVKLGPTEYKAISWSFKAPSEHTIDGQTFPLEIQVLHKDDAGDVLGVSVLFKIGASNKFLSALKEAVPQMPKWTMAHGGASATVTGDHTDFFNLEEVLPQGDFDLGGDLTFYNYEGSLTEPPCTTGVDWWVTSTPIDASKEEVSHVRSVILGVEPTKRGNNRETQELGDRKVLVGHTGFGHHVKLNGHKNDTPPHSRGYTTKDAPWHE